MIKNPVLTGFHPDPSMICVDGVYYIANSTFEYFPGVKISKSRDLANWETVGYPLDRTAFLDLRGVPKSAGIWAPCLSYCDGMFYLVFTIVKYWANPPFKDTPNYITTAKQIEGPWSPPVFLNCLGFDASLYHDDDGKKYLVNIEWDYRKKDSAQFSGILLTQLDAQTFSPLSKTVKIFKGTERALVEGPHIYKKDGYYYLLTAEGGTSYAHAETVARARDIFGPYELHPNKHLISTKHAPDCPLQKTGHGSICQAPDGRWWFAFLCGRPNDESMRCTLGRETAINEIVWVNDWPYLKNMTMVPDEFFEGYGEKQPKSAVSYDFSSEQFKKDFNGLRVPPRYEVLEDNTLRLYGGNSLVSAFGQNMLVRRQTDFKFEAQTCVSFKDGCFLRMAGLLYRYDEENQYFLRLAYNEDLNCMALGVLVFDNGAFSMPLGEREIPVHIDKLYLKLSVNRSKGRFFYSEDGVRWNDVDAEVDASKLSDDYTQPLGFTGAFIGMCCIDLVNESAYADFGEFIYSPGD